MEPFKEVTALFPLTGDQFRGKINLTIPARPLNDAQIGGLLFLWGLRE